MKITFSKINAFLLSLFILSLFMAPVYARTSSPEVAFARDGDVWLTNSSGETPKKITNLNLPNIGDGYSELPIQNIAWSPSGQKLAFVANKKGIYSLYVYDQKTEKQSVNLADDNQVVDSVIWLSEDKIIFSGIKNRNSDWRLNSNIYQLDLSDNSIKSLVSEHALEPSLSADKKKMVYVSMQQTGKDSVGNPQGEETLMLLDLKSGWQKTIAKSGYYFDDGRSFNHPKLSYDGKKIVVHLSANDFSGGVCTYDLNGKKLTSFVTDEGNNYEAYGYADFIDNNRIVFKGISSGDFKGSVNVAEADGTDRKIIKEGFVSLGATSDLSFSNDKSKLLFAMYKNDRLEAGSVYIYNLKSKELALIAKNASYPALKTLSTSKAKLGASKDNRQNYQGIIVIAILVSIVLLLLLIFVGIIIYFLSSRSK